jgi:hypothetical protein
MARDTPPVPLRLDGGEDVLAPVLLTLIGEGGRKGDGPLGSDNLRAVMLPASVGCPEIEYVYQRVSAIEGRASPL